MPAIQVMLSMEDGVLNVVSQADDEMTFALITSAWVSALEKRVRKAMTAGEPDDKRIVPADGVFKLPPRGRPR